MKSSLGSVLSVAWFLIYAVGGAFALAWLALINVDHVPPYIALAVFFWIVGFFIGHAVIEKLFSVFSRPRNTNLIARQHLQALDIDNLHLAIARYTGNNAKQPTVAFKHQLRHNCNTKKETGKIIHFLKPTSSIYKIPQRC